MTRCPDCGVPPGLFHRHDCAGMKHAPPWANAIYHPPRTTPPSVPEPSLYERWVVAFKHVLSIIKKD